MHFSMFWTPTLYNENKLMHSNRTNEKNCLKTVNKQLQMTYCLNLYHHLSVLPNKLMNGP